MRFRITTSVPAAARSKPATRRLLFLVLWICRGVAHSENAPTNEWKAYLAGGYRSDSSPALASDGTIYIGNFYQKLWAIGSNGITRWSFDTGSEIKSSPAVGNDGTIYFG